MELLDRFRRKDASAAEEDRPPVRVLAAQDEAICGEDGFSHGRYSIDAGEVERVCMLTSDKGPFADDMAVAVFCADAVYVVGSEHESFQGFVFDGLGKLFELDYTKAIDAAACTQNAQFVLWERQARQG